jgi:HEAT repeats
MAPRRPGQGFLRPSTWTTIVILSCLGMVSVSLISRQPAAEPAYSGVPLSSWLDRLDGPNRESAQTALGAIGPAGVPFLLRQVQPLKEPIYRQIYHRIRLLMPRRIQQTLASAGWRDRPRNGNLVFRVASGLSELGPAAVPRLCRALQASDDGVRAAAASALERLGPGAKEACPTLSRMLRDSNPWLEEHEVWAFEGPETGSELMIQLTFQGSTKAVAARILGAMGSEARPAVPELTSLLSDSDFFAPQYAAMALWHIARNTNGLSAFIRALPNRTDPITACRILTVLGEMGPQAKPAEPAILLLLNRTNGPSYLPQLTQRARDALEKIDPDGAAAIGAPFENFPDSAVNVDGNWPGRFSQGGPKGEDTRP